MYEVSWRYLEWFWSYRADTILSQKLILTKFKGNNSKLYIQELWFLHSACHPMLVNISMKFHEDILNGLKVIERTQFCHRNYYLQRSKEHNSKNIYPRVMVLSLCTSSFLWSFMEISWMVFKLQSGHELVTETATYKVQRGITKQIYIQELWFLRSAHRLMLVNISMKLHEDILNGFKVTERARFCDGQTDRLDSRRWLKQYVSRPWGGET